MVPHTYLNAERQAEMPTGYTSDIYDGKAVTFEEFALGCARAFGALVTMRDDPRDAEIPQEFAPSLYHARAAGDARRRLDEVLAWDEADAQDAADTAHLEAVQHAAEVTKRNSELRERYEAMLVMVNAWEPPTEDHVEFKKFMADQLQSSIDGDTYTVSVPDPVTPEQYVIDQTERAKRDIAYHEAEQAKEYERAEQRTAWVKALRASLEWVPA